MEHQGVVVGDKVAAGATGVLSDAGDGHGVAVAVLIDLDIDITIISGIARIASWICHCCGCSITTMRNWINDINSICTVRIHSGGKSLLHTIAVSNNNSDEATRGGICCTCDGWRGISGIIRRADGNSGGRRVE